MDTMAERLKHALDMRKLTPAGLIKLTGLSRAGVYFLLDGTTSAEKVRSSTVAKLCKALQVNRDWLVSGRGPIAGPVQESQPARLDPQKVREAYESVRAIYALEGKVYDIEAEPDLFATVYEQLVQITGRPSIAEMARIGRVIGERHQGGVNGDEKRAERAGIAHSEKGKKRARK